MMLMLVKALGSVFGGLVAWELVKMALWGIFILLLIRILGGDFSILHAVWDAAGWMGVGAFFLFYLLLAVRRVERHVGQYEERILRKED